MIIFNRHGYAPAGNRYDPVTATLLVAGLTMSGMAAASSYKNSKNQAKAIAAEGDIKAKERAKHTLALAGKTKTSFLTSGISLTGDGTTQNMLDDTYNVGLEDISQIKQNYNQSAKNTMGAARSKLLADIGMMAMSAAMAGASAAPETTPFLDSGWSVGSQTPMMPSSTAPFTPPIL
jgi:hypothetical protein